MNGKGIDHTLKGRANVQLAESVFRRRVRALRFALLRIDLCNLGLGITVFLFLLNELKVRFRGSELIFGLFDLTGGSRALLLQTLQGFEIALRCVTRVLGLHQLGRESQYFFLVAPASQSAGIGLRRPHHGQSACCLAAGVGVVELGK